MSNIIIPFAEATQLCCQLDIDATQQTLRRTDVPAQQSLPGQPSVSLDIECIRAYLRKELLTPKLNTLAPHLWLLATPSSDSISALNHQIVQGRTVVVTEDPELHLVRMRDRIFIKPLPPYLLSHSFWRYVFEQRWPPASSSDIDLLHRSALGFLRSYRYLVHRESDFRLASGYHLLPASVTFEEFHAFIGNFAAITDADVSPRYHWGQLRLSRLNFWSKIFLLRFNFEETFSGYDTYFARFYAPLLFAFGIFSVLLGAMQVGLAVEPNPSLGSSWVVFGDVSRWFSVSVILIVAIAGLALLLLVCYMVVSELVYACMHRRRA